MSNNVTFNGNGKPKANASLDTAETKRRAFLVRWILRLATAFGVQLPDERVELYVEKFSHVEPEVFHVACRACEDTWLNPGQMPTPGQLFELITRHRIGLEEELKNAAKLGDDDAKTFLAKLEAKQIALTAPSNNDTEQERSEFTQRVIVEMQERLAGAIPNYKPGHAPGIPTNSEERHKWARHRAAEILRTDDGTAGARMREANGESIIDVLRARRM